MDDKFDFSHLVAFEAAARQGNFTRAGDTLGLSQPALSHRIRMLETSLGRRLFTRRHKGVSLTQDGETLFAAVTESLDRIREVIERFRRENANPRIRISLDFAFSTLWLMPRLIEHDLAPETIDLQVNSAHQPPLRHLQDSDIAFILADPAAMPTHAIRLIPEVVVPVCSPAFLQAHPDAEDPTRLASLPLIHNTAPAEGAWLTWRDWALQNDLAWHPTGAQSSFTMYQLVIQATLAGRGLALGWHGLVDDLLRAGQLVAPVAAEARSSRWYLAVLATDTPTPAVLDFLAAIKDLMMTEAPTNAV